jgi:protein-tyrosine phosphatase
MDNEQKAHPDFSGETTRNRKSSRPRRVLITLLSVIVLAAIVTPGAMYIKWRSFDHRFTQIDPGRVFRSAAMPPEELINKCREYGIKTVVDLRKEQEGGVPLERDALMKSGIRHVSLPMKQVPEQTIITTYLALMDDPKTYPVLIHCKHGVGRTGVMSAIYRMEYQRWDNERARREANLLGGMESFDRDVEKGRFLFDYVPRWKKLKFRSDDAVSPSTPPKGIQ